MPTNRTTCPAVAVARQALAPSLEEALTDGLRLAKGAAVLLCLGLSRVPDLAAQRTTRVGIRGGAGVDGTGQTVYGGQIELTELGTSHSVEVAVAAFGSRLHETSTIRAENRLDSYEDATEVRGIALMGSVLIGHAQRRGWPYLLVGIGLGPLEVDWRRASPTDDELGTPLSGGGSFREERVLKVGTQLQFGIGHRLHERLDVRAQGQAVLVPSTDLRQELKVAPAITLTAGVGL